MRGYLPEVSHIMTWNRRHMTQCAPYPFHREVRLLIADYEMFEVRAYWAMTCLDGAPMGNGSLAGAHRVASIVHCSSASRPRAVRQPVR